MALKIFYCLLLLTALIFSPSSSLETYGANSGAMWVKIVSSWLCAGLYLWTMVAPCILTDRDFGYE